MILEARGGEAAKSLAEANRSGGFLSDAFLRVLRVGDSGSLKKQYYWSRVVNGSDAWGRIQAATLLAFWWLAVMLAAMRIMLRVQRKAYVQLTAGGDIAVLYTKYRHDYGDDTVCLPMEAAREVDDALSQTMERVGSELTIARFLVWVIPSIGFIGTVVGISNALGDTGSVMTEDILVRRSAVQSIATQLGTAFDTTLVALVLSIVGVFGIHAVQYLGERLALDGRRWATEKRREGFVLNVPPPGNGSPERSGHIAITVLSTLVFVVLVICLGLVAQGFSIVDLPGFFLDLLPFAER